MAKKKFFEDEEPVALSRKEINNRLYNIRKRFVREAKRMEKAGKSIDAANFREIAEQYKTKNILAAAGVKSRSAEAAAVLASALEEGERSSAYMLKTAKGREQAALKSIKGNAGSQFYAITKELWFLEPGDGHLPDGEKNRRIMEGLGVSSIAEAIEKIEDNTGLAITGVSVSGEKIYDPYTVALGQMYISSLYL